jgi:peptidyl-prolyl cis-trans isomerase A (cyclophilin A)
MIILRRQFIVGAGLVAASPALAQPPAAPPAPAPDAAPAPAGPPPLEAGKVRVAINTGQGTILLDLEAEKAPVTAANFLRYVDQKRYDGCTFYRASRPPGATTDDYGVIQGGLEGNPAKVLRPIAHEPTTKTGLKHGNGTISMGRNAPGTATSDFFICVGEASYLDADPTKPGDNVGYAAFGQVVQGMDVVKKILVMPTSPTKGVGPMKGQMLEPRVPITSMRRVAS